VTKAPTPSARLGLKVVPGSSRDEVVGWLGDALKIKLTAPPEKGRANEAVVALLADRLGPSAALVAVVGGHSSPSEVIAITGVAVDHPQARPEDRRTRPDTDQGPGLAGKHRAGAGCGKSPGSVSRPTRRAHLQAWNCETPAPQGGHQLPPEPRKKA